MRLLGEYLRSRFGCKVYKVALNGGFTCPNRDGTLGTRGCIFCSAGGSGEFAESSDLSITDQIERGKERVRQKMKSGLHRHLRTGLKAESSVHGGNYAPGCCRHFHRN